MRTEREGGRREGKTEEGRKQEHSQVRKSRSKDSNNNEPLIITNTTKGQKQGQDMLDLEVVAGSAQAGATRKGGWLPECFSSGAKSSVCFQIAVVGPLTSGFQPGGS